MPSRRPVTAACALVLAGITSAAASPASRTRLARHAPVVAASTADQPPTRPMTAAEARVAVTMLDDAYQIILHQVHHAYPTQPGRPVAATIVRDLQKVMTEKGWPASHFLAVNAIIMNPDHRARDAFERDVVMQFAKSDGPIEKIEKGRLRIATMVPLGGECFSCHWANAGISSRAAISFTIPLKK